MIEIDTMFAGIGYVYPLPCALKAAPYVITSSTMALLRSCEM